MQDPGWSPPAASAPPDASPNRAAWRDGLPEARGRRAHIRELVPADAATLLVMMGQGDVTRFLADPPPSVEGFEQFVAWTHQRRREGSYLCFGIVPNDADFAVGFFQIRPLEADFRTTEWGFALGRPYWGTGLFTDAATLLLGFAFGRLGVVRLQARAAAGNVRCHGALRKLGAARTAVLPGAFSKRDEVQDEIVWSLTAADWAARARGGRVLSHGPRPARVCDTAR